jgi:tRNA threonylcarbamoyladenosine biosynthesis protein TsaE
MSVDQGDYSHLLDWLEEREFVSRSEEETLRLAERLGSQLTGKEVVLLTGELGAGKTVFTKGLALGAGVSDINCVCSPTFTLINIYQGRQTLYHIDLYRLEKASEIEDLGWEDYIGTGIVVVEWAERLPFPVEGVSVRIEVDADDTRTISMSLRSP